jgi:hypothetical protein
MLRERFPVTSIYLFGSKATGHDEWLHGPYQVLAIRREVDRDGVAA